MQRSVTLQVDGQPLRSKTGQTLLAALQAAGLPVPTACGGTGSCHLCRVQVTTADLPAPTAIEQQALGNVPLRQGLRLACQLAVTKPLTVALPATESPKQRRARIRAAKLRRSDPLTSEPLSGSERQR